MLEEIESSGALSRVGSKLKYDRQRNLQQHKLREEMTFEIWDIWVYYENLTLFLLEGKMVSVLIGDLLVISAKLLILQLKQY